MTQVTISTVELAEFVNQVRSADGITNTVRHEHMYRKVKGFSQNAATPFQESTYTTANGITRNCYELTKQQAYRCTITYGKHVADKVYALMHLWEKEGKTPITRDVSNTYAPNQPKVVFTEVSMPVAAIPEVQATQNPNEVTMTSLELVDFINELRKNEGGYVLLQHRSFMAKVRKVLGDDGVQKFLHTHTNPQNNQEYLICRFPKREATLMAMSYSHKISAQVYDRMDELERKVVGSVPAVPTSFREALQLALRQQEQIEFQAKELAAKEQVIAVKEQALTIAAPKVKFHDSSLRQGYNYTATDIAKKLNVSAYQLNNWLISKNALFKTRKHFQQWYLDKGYGIEKFVEAGDKIYQNIYHTDAGASWILSNFNG
jgi:phage antirepressor YoqD-like protein